jgi:autotransporter-associated beta strand protein
MGFISYATEKHSIVMGWDLTIRATSCTLLIVLFSTTSAHAGLVWDADTATPGIQDGAGMWTAIGDNWMEGAFNVTYYDHGGSAVDVTFGRGESVAQPESYEVSLGGDSHFTRYNAFANSLTFEPGGSYTLIDKTPGSTASINLTSGNIVANADATINVFLESANPLSISGSGTLTLLGSTPFKTPSTITVGSSVISAGGEDHMQAATISLNDANAVLTLQGPYEQLANAATVNISAGALKINNSAPEKIQNLVMTGGKIEGTGSLNVLVGSGNRYDVQAGEINVNLTGSPLEKSGPGTVTLSPPGNNTYSGGTTLNAGTLKLGSSGALPVNGTLRFNGGILELNNQVIPSSGVLGALILQADSGLVFDPNGASGSITFSGASWTDGTLTVAGWQATGAGRDYLYSVTDPGAFLQHVEFRDANNALISSSGLWDPNTHEIYPAISAAPEPVNVALGLFGCGFIGVQLFRRYLGKSRL